MLSRGPYHCASLLLALVSLTASSQIPPAVCDRGTGHFEKTTPSGVTVRVGAVTNGGFATRACQAVLTSINHRDVAVKSAAQVDIDVFGADLGFGVPVLALVVRPTRNDWHASYQIWSLDKKPHLLRTLEGGDSYRAVDADFNQQVAIWTTDAAAVESFDGLHAADLIAPPTVVLQFQHGHLVDVSAWYRAHYDRQISALRGILTAPARAQFLNSADGQLKADPLPAAASASLLRTKAAILQIVWAYLYSGRPDRAWAELTTSWPAADRERVKAAILAARSQGIEAQITKVASATYPPKWLDNSAVYEFLKPTGQQGDTSGRLTYNALGVTGPGAVLVKDDVSSSINLLAADIEPKPISLWRPPPSAAEQAVAFSPETLLLTIDEAGKVHSATMQVPASDPELLQAAKDWKFTPALLDGKPVAYKLKLDVQPFR